MLSVHQTSCHASTFLSDTQTDLELTGGGWYAANIIGGKPWQWQQWLPYCLHGLLDGFIWFSGLWAFL